MDYQHLLFASEVRKLAAERRQKEREKIEVEYGRAQEADRQDMLDAWDNEFPLTSYVSSAYAEIAEVAKQVEELKTGGEISGKSFWDLSDNSDGGERAE
jgi:hypothetical protein